MDLVVSIKIAPGEGGMAERHTWTLKEVQTTRQCLDFVEVAVAPFTGAQQELPAADVAPPIVAEKAVEREANGRGKGRAKKKAKEEVADSDPLPWETNAEDDGMMAEA